jgi:mono/diheme cytochrome c family protein
MVKVGDRLFISQTLGLWKSTVCPRFFLIPLWFFSGSLFGQTVWDGVYSGDQAKRGETAYTQYCIACHKPDLLGVEGAMKGELFMERRREDSLETLFLDMKATMPRGRPGSLPDQTYADLIAYFLQNNEMPAGPPELKPTALEKIQLVGKDGPKPVPNFALVLTVGCLIQIGENAWTLVNASEPVRTRDSFKTIDKELTASRSRALGQLTFRLADAENFDAAANVGKKIQAKGVIVRSPSGNRINVNSIEGLADECR